MYVDARNLCYFILLIPFIRPRSWESIYTVQQLYYYWGYISAAICILLLLWKALNCFLNRSNDIEKIKSTLSKNSIYIVLIVYYLIFAVNTYIQANEDFEYALKEALTEIGFIILILLWTRYDFGAFLKSCSFLFKLLILLNFVFMVISPELFGTGTDGRLIYLLGEKNYLIYFILPGIIIICINDLYRFQRMAVNTNFIILIAAASCLFAFSGTSAGTLIIFGALVVFQLQGYRAGEVELKLFTGKNLFIIYAIASILIICLQNVALFSGFIEIVLGKSSDFSNRILIWAQALITVAEHPLFGLGGYFTRRYQVEYSYKFGCHNSFLQNLTDAGLISTILIISTIWLVMCKLDKYSDSFLPRFISAGIFACLLSCLTESIFFYLIILVLLIAWELCEDENLVSEY